MYCLSQFCCLCFRSKVKLKLLHKITSVDATFSKTANVIIPEIQLSEFSHVLSVCEDCVNFVTEMHTFRQNCIKNNLLLVEYIKLLSSGGEIGNAQIQISDFMQEGENIATNVQQSIIRVDIKTERVENGDSDYDVSSDLADLHCDETAISDNETLEEAMKYKIEVNDDFNDKYDCKEEIKIDDPLEEFFDESRQSPELQEEEIRNDDQLEELFDNPLYSAELQGVDNTSSKSSPTFPEDNEPDVTKHYQTNNLYTCKICQRSLKTKATFKQHILTHDNNRKEYKCETCGKYFNSIFYLKSHNMIHTGEKPYKCETCGKGYIFKSSLHQHTSVHSREKPYECKTCGKRFALSYILKKHAMIHTVEKWKNRCEICGKYFTSVYNLKQHVLIHEKPHKCNTCGKCFASLGALKGHVMIHTGEKPHECNICGKYFRLVSHLKLHEQMHFDNKQHKCDICEKSFAVRIDLTRHKSSHSEGKLFKCNLCEQSYTRGHNLRKHMSRRHP